MESPTTELSAAEQQYNEELESELRALAQLPLVTAVDCYDHGDDMQKKRVQLTLDTKFLSHKKPRKRKRALLREGGSLALWSLAREIARGQVVRSLRSRERRGVARLARG